MRAKFIYENDIFKPKSKKELEKAYQDYLKNNDFIGVNSLEVGKTYMAQEATSFEEGTGIFIPVKVLLLLRTGLEDWDVTVQLENGETQEWNINVREPIFKKMKEDFF